MTDKTPSQKAETLWNWYAFANSNSHDFPCTNYLKGMEAYQRSLRKLVEDRIEEYKNTLTGIDATYWKVDPIILELQRFLQLIDTVEPPKQ